MEESEVEKREDADHIQPFRPSTFGKTLAHTLRRKCFKKRSDMIYVL